MAVPSIFISYSHKDEDWKNRLLTHLGVLVQESILDLWEDRRIEAGDDWKPEIEKAIEKADIALLMISANFLTSKFILTEEVPKLLSRREKDGVRVIPVIVKPCAWSRVGWLSKLQARPRDGRALSNGSENQVDMDLAIIADEIVTFVENLKSETSQDRLAETIPNVPAHTGKTIHQSKVDQIKDLIRLGDYEKAIVECNAVLDIAPEQPLINLLAVIAGLKGRGADRYQTKTIQRLEQHLRRVCDDPKYYPTGLMIWGLIKHDHYVLNALHQEKPTLHDINQSLANIDLEEIDLDLVEKVKAGHRAYEALNLVRFYPG